jgi:glycosyltransferase involved in cell wall biosynthesis
MMKKSSAPVLGMILKGYPRISETFISNEIALLEEMGFDIHIFSMRKPREAFSHKSIERIKAGVTYLPSTLFSSLHKFFLPNLRTFLKHPKNYRKALARMARSFLRGRKSASIKHVLQAGYLVDKMARAGNVTHLHAHFAHSPTSVAFYSALISGVSFSFTGHAKDIYTQKPEKLSRKLALTRFVVTCTEYNKKYLQTLVNGSKPVHAVYHGIDLELFKSERENSAPKPPYKIMTVARFVEKKGLPTVLKALALTQAKGHCL